MVVLMTSPMESLGERVKFLRQCLGKTQTEMAHLLGMKRYTSFARYEDNSRMPDQLGIEKMATVGLTTVNWIQNGEIEKKICEKIKSTRMRFGKVRDVAQKLGVTVEYIRAIEDYSIAPSEVFIYHLCNVYHLNKYEMLAGTFPGQAASPTLYNSKEDYELNRTHAFETSLSKLGLLEIWYELREEIFKDPKIVGRLSSYVKDKTTQEQMNEKEKYFQGQIDMLRGMLQEKAREVGALTLENGKLASKVDDLERRFK
jgi:transcriptional regulator with XRE-family HTH domain